MKCEIEKGTVVNKCCDYDEHWAEIMHDDWQLDRHRDDGNGGAFAPSFNVAAVIREKMQDYLFDYQDVKEVGACEIFARLGLVWLVDIYPEDTLIEVLLRLGGGVQTREVCRSVVENGGHSMSFVEPMGKMEEERFVESEKLFRKAFFNALWRKRGLEGVGLGSTVVREPCVVAEAAA